MKRRLFRLLPFCLLLGSLDASTEPRKWTSADGKQLEGVFLRADNRSVTIRRPEGRSVDIPIERLSESDRSYLTDLLEKMKAAPGETAEKAKGRIRYKLSDGSEKWDEARKKRIVDAMDAAVTLYNQHSNFKKELTANDSPGTPTADANYAGWMNFGGQIGYRVALHEMGHTLGIGTHPNWGKNIKDGLWTGKYALAQLREFDGEKAVLHADRMHFWPYGMNFDNEASPENNVRHVKMVVAMCKDMGEKGID